MSAAAGYLPRSRLQSLFDCLQAAGYQCLGPKVKDDAVVFTHLHTASELPFGIHVEQQPGHYRIEQTEDPRCFVWANGPQAVKPHLFTTRETLWRVERDANGHLQFIPVNPTTERLAIIGMRACDIAALQLQDRHFLASPYTDTHYQARRKDLCIVAVHCAQPAATCFCVSTGDGPQAQTGFDLALTELAEGYLIRPGSANGLLLYAQLDLLDANTKQLAEERTQFDHARSCQQRRLPGTDLRIPLMAALEHPRWNEVATRCLACGNCTQVCPTCFCHSSSTTTDLNGHTAECLREWDSCFSSGHSHMHGYQVRPDIRSRYRQWLTHKLSAWHDQYGRSGCVGCGRCIAWCPVGIDLTEEATALCSNETVS